MKLITIIFTLLLTFGLAPLNNAQLIEKNKLSVYGKVKTYAKADRVKISFSINSYGKSLGVAFDKAKKQMNEISQKLKALGLIDKNISTSFFTSSENYGSKAFLSSKKDFIAIMSASITTEDLNLIEKILIAISESKIKRVDKISFELINLKELKEKALKEAIEKAKQKAVIISESLNISFSSIVGFQELFSDGSRFNKNRENYYREFNSISVRAAMDILPSNEGGFFAEELSFETEVMITYEIAE